MSDTSHDLNKEIKIYKSVYIGLLVLTVITVMISNFHFELRIAVSIALMVATLKASLVASYFMHLAHEKPIILWIVSIVLFYFISMILLIYFGKIVLPEGLHYVP